MERNAGLDHIVLLVLGLEIITSANILRGQCYINDSAVLLRRVLIASNYSAVTRVLLRVQRELYYIHKEVTTVQWVDTQYLVSWRYSSVCRVIWTELSTLFCLHLNIWLYVNHQRHSKEPPSINRKSLVISL